jgi:hypothetical protein
MTINRVLPPAIGHAWFRYGFILLFEPADAPPRMPSFPVLSRHRRVFSLFTAELVSNPNHRPVDHGPIIAGQVHDTCLDDESAQLDQMPRAPAARDLPASHVMPGASRLMAVARYAVAFERRQRGGQVPV